MLYSDISYTARGLARDPRFAIAAPVTLALDLGGPAGLSRSLSVMLRALAPLDPATYVAVASLLAAVSALASCVRARRAAMVDPMAAIRRE